jgi:predicted Fe-Mo cluster-binding NifX family protein
MSVKIAVASDNGADVSAHLGRCASFVIFDVGNGAVTSQTVRQRSDGGCRAHESSLAHDAHHARTHACIIDLIKDCKALLCGGMGPAAFEQLESFGIRPILTDETDARAAAAMFAKGELPPSRRGLCKARKH